MADRIEEYAYYSAGFAEPQNLTIPQLALRLSRFYEVFRKANKAAKTKGGPPNSKTNRRRFK